MGMGLREGLNGRRVEEGGRRRAVGDREVVSREPGPIRHPPLDHPVGGCERLPRVGYAPHIALALRAQVIEDDLLHGLVHVEIDEAVPQPRVEREGRVWPGNSRRSPG